MAEDKTPKLAVLIDADNTSVKVAGPLFEEIAKLGDANVRRIYGDFASGRMSGWTKALPGLAIIPQQQFAYTTGKNASDITMVIDAMDLLHKGGLDGFCLVSSDSDFTRLAQRLREEGAAVYGFGEKKTPEAFRNACSRFIFIENLIETPDETPAASKQARTPAKESPKKAAPILMKAMAELEDDEGWAHLGAVNQRIPSFAPDFDPRTYGCKKMIDLVEKSGAFEIRRPGEGRVLIRVKQKSRAK